MQRTCTQCSADFEITDDDLAFYDKISPIFNGKKELIPPPTHCPQCRLQRRLAFRNPIHIYHRTSSSSGKPIFSMYTPDTPLPVIENEEWYGDTWDALDTGQDFDPKRPAFEQLWDLWRANPLPARSFIPEMVNSDYCSNATALKNCYMTFNASYSEDCMYCESTFSTRDCIDCTRVPRAELCYDCCACGDSYNVQSSDGARHCSDSYFLRDCLSCKRCFGCVNLCRREYCIFNEQKTKEEYEAFLSTIDLQSFQERSEWDRKFMEFAMTQPQPELKALQCENVSGNYISNCKETHDSFFISKAENARYCFGLDDTVKDCMDVTLWGDGIELAYDCTIIGGQCSNILFSYYMFAGNSDQIYCMAMTSCSNCFGCMGLKHKRYCIFNKQYTKEEYETLVPKIIAHMRTTGEWGEFFPVTMSPIPYNQSLAQRYYPLPKEQVLQRGLRWHEPHREDAKGIDPQDLPDRLPETDEPIIVKSALSGRPFKITSEEIKRYRQFNVPLPRITYDERMEERSRSMGELVLYDRTCAKTGKPIKTTFPPESPWTVWAKDEWDKEFWT